jgi:hypothetical protein
LARRGGPCPNPWLVRRVSGEPVGDSGSRKLDL